MKPEFDVFINWAGWVVDDEVFKPEQIAYLNSRRLIHIRGSEDQYYNESREAKLKSIISNHGLEMDFKTFEGRHKVYTEVLQGLFYDEIL